MSKRWIPFAENVAFLSTDSQEFAVCPCFCWFSLVHLNSLIHSMDLSPFGEVDNQLAMTFEASHESQIFIIMFTRTHYYREPDESNRHSDVVSLTFVAR
jgi:hypothetical protein